MPIPTIICDPNQLAIQAACFSANCLGPDDREAIDIHARVRELAAIGGTSYIGHLPQLLVDAKSWSRLDEDTRRTITLLLDIDNAINKGASFPTDINSLRRDSRCYLCLPWEQKKNVKLFLKCRLNLLGQPE